jgi:hypothetical protein
MSPHRHHEPQAQIPSPTFCYNTLNIGHVYFPSPIRVPHASLRLLRWIYKSRSFHIAIKFGRIGAAHPRNRGARRASYMFNFVYSRTWIHVLGSLSLKGAKLKNNEQEESTLPLATLQSFRHQVCVIDMSFWSCFGLSTSLTHAWPLPPPNETN